MVGQDELGVGFWGRMGGGWETRGVGLNCLVEGGGARHRYEHVQAKRTQTRGGKHRQSHRKT